MDAVKFVKEYLRMCTKVYECEDCPVCKTYLCTVPAKERSQKSAEKIVELVEEWSAAHPRKTRQSVFLEQYPEALLDVNGLLDMCPAPIFLSHRLVGGGCRDPHKKCVDCKREFWLREVE